MSAPTAAARFTKSAFFTSSRSGESKFALQSRKKGKSFQLAPLHLLIPVSRFKCDGCHKAAGSSRKENRFTAKRLQTTRLGNYIETRVNNFLRKKEADAGDVHIRVVFSGDKQVEVKPGMKHRSERFHLCIHTVSSSILSYLYSNLIATNNTCLIVLIQISHSPRK